MTNQQQDKENKFIKFCVNVDRTIKENISIWIVFLLLMLITLAGFFVKSNINHRNHFNNIPRYVSVDIQGMTNTFIQMVVNNNFKDSQYQNLLLKYDRTLSHTIDEVSKKNNFIIMKKDTTHTIIPDITPQVQEIVFREFGFKKVAN